MKVWAQYGRAYSEETLTIYIYHNHINMHYQKFLQLVKEGKPSMAMIISRESTQEPMFLWDMEKTYI